MINLFLFQGEMSKKYGGNIEMPDQRLKYEEM